MIAVLGRQSVRKRISPARMLERVHQRAAGAVQKRTSEAKPPGKGLSILQGQRPERHAERKARRAPFKLFNAGRIRAGQLFSARKRIRGGQLIRGAGEPVQHPAGSARGDLRIRFSLAARPMITAAFVGVLLTALLAPALALKAAGVPAALLPSSADAEQELYRRIVPPEETERVQGVPARLSSLSVGSYTIRTGDTISQIAQRLKLEVGTLISFNGIRDAKALAVGSVLKYPNSDGLLYRVRRGDSLGSIASSFSVPLEGILDWNQVDSSIITVGQELFIPGGHLSTAEINKVLGTMFVFPFSGRISSRFGDRNDPFTGVERFHNGLDIVGAYDSPIKAVMGGKVSLVGTNATYGRYIILTHPGTGYQSMYAHLDKVLVSRGENVTQGQKIGLMGNTGHVTGTHLHFSLFKNNEPVDPLRYLK